MKKRKLTLAIALVAAVTLPASVFAATSGTGVAKSVRGFFGLDTSKLTDAQKADVSTYNQKMADLQKEYINKMVENGSMTKEQGDAAIKKIEENLKNGKVEGITGGFGREGKKGEAGMDRIDTSKLTEAQKAELTGIAKEMATLQKEVITKMVTDGLLTKAQGETATKKTDELAANLNMFCGMKGMAMGKGGFLFGIGGADTSKLTDTQKTYLKDYSKKMADLQKEVINKLVSDGLMTKVQGDSAIQRIDDMQKNIQDNGFQNNFGMKRGHFREGGKQDASQNKTDNTATSM